MHLKKPSLKILQSQIVLSIFDAVFALVVVGSATVGYWRGVWNLMGIYVYPDDYLKSCLISLVLGFGGMLAMSLAQGPIKRFMEGKSKLTFIAVSIIYTEIYGLFCVNSWRGAWLLGDLFDKMPIEAVAATTLLAVIILARMKALRNTTAPPCAVVVGNKEDYFDTSTYFKINADKNICLYVLDSTFSVLLIGFLVVVIWRGMWALVDYILFPGDVLLSVLSSVIIGYATALIAFSIEPLMHLATERLKGIWKYLVLDVYYLLIVFAALNAWRGLWNLTDMYFMPDYPILSNWVSHLVSFSLLMLLNCGNSVLVRGVIKDAEESPSGKVIVMPTHYLRVYFSKTEEEKTTDAKC